MAWQVHALLIILVNQIKFTFILFVLLVFCMFESYLCLCSAGKVQNSELRSLELTLQIILCWNVGDWNSTWVVLQEPQRSLIPESSLKIMLTSSPPPYTHMKTISLYWDVSKILPKTMICIWFFLCNDNCLAFYRPTDSLSFLLISLQSSFLSYGIPSLTLSNKHFSTVTSS